MCNCLPLPEATTIDSAKYSSANILVQHAARTGKSAKRSTRRWYAERRASVQVTNASGLAVAPLDNHALFAKQRQGALQISLHEAKAAYGKVMNETRASIQ